MNDNTTCAYVDWVERWRTETDLSDWVAPDEEVIERASAVHAAGASAHSTSAAVLDGMIWQSPMLASRLTPSMSAKPA